jgi:hypothetical protein
VVQDHPTSCGCPIDPESWTSCGQWHRNAMLKLSVTINIISFMILVLENKVTFVVQMDRQQVDL